jgi:hypothetical protein
MFTEKGKEDLQALTKIKLAMKQRNLNFKIMNENHASSATENDGLRIKKVKRKTPLTRMRSVKKLRNASSLTTQ